LPSGTVSSTATGCLAAGYGDADVLEADVYVAWSGTVTSAKLVGDEFNVGWRHDIYLNNTLIGQSILDPNGSTNGTYCTPLPGSTKEWTLDPGLVRQGLNRIRLTPGATGRNLGRHTGGGFHLHQHIRRQHPARRRAGSDELPAGSGYPSVDRTARVGRQPLGSAG
jgi:hypothetical protein